MVGQNGSATQVGVLPWAPDWTENLDIALWVSNPDQRVSAITERASILLGFEHEACIGSLCYQTVAALDLSGKPFCRRDCPLRAERYRALHLEVLHLLIPGADNAAKPVHLLPIRVRGPDGRTPWIVHCVLEAERCQRVHAYLACLARRQAGSVMADGVERSSLTRREREILELLAVDTDLRRIAEDLHISYHTVRNHIQNILPKLSAHSIPQAVAVFLLDDERSGT